jgi:glyceraldehyde-3-phosphate dehydrogenase/erythrose-4-phosphate dehydrogenase
LKAVIKQALNKCKHFGKALKYKEEEENFSSDFADIWRTLIFALPLNAVALAKAFL